MHPLFGKRLKSEMTHKQQNIRSNFFHKVNYVTIVMISIVLISIISCGKPEKIDDTLYRNNFTSNYKQAIQQAKTENKHLLLNFTGSDFCPPCKLLKRNVFNTSQFIEQAKQHFIFVEIDFPQYKKLPEALWTQNMFLQRKYQVHSFPTIIIIDAEEKVLDLKTAYRNEGPEEYLSALKKVIKK